MTQPITTEKNMKKPGILTWIVPMLLWTGIACAQHSERELETRYVQSLEDSLVRYELLKPATYNLQQTNVHREKENQELRMQLRIMSFNHEIERSSFARQIKAAEKKNWKWFCKGFFLGLIGGSLTR
jgi:hypothetical protein